jgi:polyphosphate kinase 2 (PPK2 family)
MNSHCRSPAAVSSWRHARTTLGLKASPLSTRQSATPTVTRPNREAFTRQGRPCCKEIWEVKLTGKAYARELAKLHAELLKLQLWVVDKGPKVCVVFEGRDGAGKGGVIKAITSELIFPVAANPSR